jgi:hypothetical protein
VTTDLLNGAAVLPLVLLSADLFDEQIHKIALGSNKLIVSLACVAMLLFIFRRLFGRTGTLDGS